MLTLLLIVDKFALPTFVSSAARLRVASPLSAPLVVMNTRVFIPVLCIGAVVFACGPRAREDAAVKQSGVAIAATTRAPQPRTATRSTARDERATPIDAELFVNAQDASVRLALYVENTGKKSVELTFPTGQTHDFVVLDTLGRELWRWSRDRMFTQTLRNRLLGRGETLNVEETWQSATLAPGTYVARAVLKSQNYPVQQEKRFTVQGTTVATR